MQTICKKDAMKIFYYLMAIDHLLEEELQKFDEIGAEIDSNFLDYKSMIFSECSAKMEAIIDDRFAVVQEYIDEILYNANEFKGMDTIPVRMLIWDMLVMANADSDYSSDEMQIIRHVVRVCKFDMSVYMEMEQTIKTAVAIAKEFDYLKSSQKPYSEVQPVIDEITRRQKNIVASITALIEDDSFEDETYIHIEKITMFGDRLSKVQGEIGKGTKKAAEKIGKGAVSAAGKIGKGIAPVASNVKEDTKALLGKLKTNNKIDNSTKEGDK